MRLSGGQQRRLSLACAIIHSPSTDDSSHKSILVTGGVLGSSTDKDEIFDLAEHTSETVDSLNIPRYNHKMVNIGEKVFAIGGQRHTSDDSPLDVIEVFDPNSESWSEHTSSLISKSTDDLAVTELPVSAVSCNQGCQCGVKSGARIVGGAEAQVTGTIGWVFPPENFCSRLPPIPGWASCSLPVKPTFLRLNVQQHW